MMHRSLDDDTEEHVSCHICPIAPRTLTRSRKDCGNLIGDEFGRGG